MLRKRAIHPVLFPCGVKFPDISISDLHKHLLGDDANVPITIDTQQCAYHGSSYDIQAECDAGPSYVIQRLWDPGGPICTSRTSQNFVLPPLGTPKGPIDHFLWLSLCIHICRVTHEMYLAS